MSQSQSFHCPQERFPEVITSLEEWLADEGFNHQQIEVEDRGILIQIIKIGKWRRVVGMSTALNIVFHQTNDTLNIEIGEGRWLDKATAGAISLFILWPLAVTASIGAWQQMKMPERIFSHIADAIIPNQAVPIGAKALHEKVRQFEKYTRDWDYWGEKIPKEKLSNAKQAHERENDHIIFLYDHTLWGSAKKSVLVTNQGISFKYETDVPALFFSWESIDKFHIEDTIAHIKSHGKLYSLKFCYTSEACPQECKDFLAELSMQEQSQFMTDLRRVREIILNAKKEVETNKESLRQAISLCDQLLTLCEISPAEINYQKGEPEKNILYSELGEIIYLRAYALWVNGHEEQAKEDLIRFVKRQEEEIPNIEKNLLAEIYQLIAEINLNQKQSAHAIVFLSKACNIGSVDSQRRVKESLRQLRKTRANILLEEPYEHRQILFCTDDIPSWIITDFCFVNEHTLKSIKWEFEIGHPQKGVFYVCHPLHPNRYFPLEEFHDKIFEDKHAELVYLLQSIGANHIHVEVERNILGEDSLMNDRKLNETDEIITNLSVQDATKGIVKIHHQKGQSGVWDIELQPIGKPHIPTDLVWYQHEPTWQRIAKSALTGSYKKVTLELQYQEDFSINERRIRQIEGGLSLFSQKGEVQWSQETEERLQQRKKLTWKFTASFPESIEQNTNQTLMENLTEQEKEYIEELEDCLVDRNISNDERRILERRKQKLGLNNDRAIELERLVKENLHII